MDNDQTPRDAGPDLDPGPTPPIDVAPGEPLEIHPQEVVRGAVRGVVALMTRTAGLQVMGFVAFVVLARLISPVDFGLFVIALAVENFAVLIITAGLPASVIRHPSPPTPPEERALAGFSLLISVSISGLAMVTAFIVLPALGMDSTPAKVIAIALLALPLLAARMIPFALLARQMRFDRIAIIDVASRTALYCCALPAAALGFGAYGLAAAIPVAALTSSALASRMQPWARGFTLDLGRASGHLRFGLRVGVFRFFNASFNSGFVAVLALAAGAGLAGFFGMSVRVLGIPLTAVTTLQRVGLSALSRVAASAERTRRMIQASALSAVGVGLPLAVLVGSAEPLVSFVFGDRWLPAVDMIVISAPGVLLFASIGSVAASRAFADGEPRSPIVAAAGRLAVAAALAVVLVPEHGTAGAGISLAAGYLVYSGYLFVRVHADAARWQVAWPVLRALLVAAVAAAAGQVLRPGEGLTEVAVAVTASGVAWLAMAMILTRSELLSLIRLLRQHLRRTPEPNEASIGG